MTSTLGTTRTTGDTLQTPPIERASRRRSLRNLGSLIKSNSLLSLDEKSSFLRRQSPAPAQHDDVEPVRKPVKKPSRLKRLLGRRKKGTVEQHDSNDDDDGEEEERREQNQPQLRVEEKDLTTLPSPPETPSTVSKKNKFGSVSSADMEIRRSSWRRLMLRPSQQQLAVSSPHSSVSDRDIQSNTSTSSAGNEAPKAAATESPNMFLASHQNQQDYQHHLPPQLPQLPDSEADVSLWSSILLDANPAFKDDWQRRASLASSTTTSTHTTQSTDGYRHVSNETSLQPTLEAQTKTDESKPLITPSPFHEPNFCSMRSTCESCARHHESSKELPPPANSCSPPVLEKKASGSQISLDHVKRRTPPPSIVVEPVTPPTVEKDHVVMVEQEEETATMQDAQQEAEAPVPEREQQKDLPDVLPVIPTHSPAAEEDEQQEQELEYPMRNTENDQGQPILTTESIDQLEQTLHSLAVTEASEEGDPVMIAGLTPAPVPPAITTAPDTSPPTVQGDSIDSPAEQVEKHQHSETSVPVPPSPPFTPTATIALTAAATATAAIVPNPTFTTAHIAPTPPLSADLPDTVATNCTASIHSSIHSLAATASSTDFNQFVESCRAHSERLEQLAHELQQSEMRVSTPLEAHTSTNDSQDESEQLHNRHLDRFQRMFLQQSTMLTDLEKLVREDTEQHARAEENDRAFGFLRDTTAAGTRVMQARWYLNEVTGGTVGTGKIIYHGSKDQLIVAGTCVTTESSLLPKVIHRKCRHTKE